MKRFAITAGFLQPGGDPSDLEQLAHRCTELGHEGVDFLLIREKQLSDRELYLATRRILKALENSQTLLFVAGRPHVARAAAADGVHLGSHFDQAREARRIVPEAWVSVSCHTLADVHAAKAAGADLCLFAPVFGKTVDGIEVAPPAGLELLRQACAIAGADLPVFALGGVTPANAPACLAAGAVGVAGIRMFFPAEAAIVS